VAIRPGATEVSWPLLDRLIDLDPAVTAEAPLTHGAQLRRFEAGLCRDLSALLNTRRAAEELDPEYEECRNSLLSFGIADFTSYNLKSGAEQEDLRRSIERAIRRFEPRLARVSVTLEEPDPVQPVLRFQIEALMWSEALPEAVVLDASLRRESRRIAVSGGRS
jgi:type VI secretion system protein ImpF